MVSCLDLRIALDTFVALSLSLAVCMSDEQWYIAHRAYEDMTSRNAVCDDERRRRLNVTACICSYTIIHAIKRAPSTKHRQEMSALTIFHRHVDSWQLCYQTQHAHIDMQSIETRRFIHRIAFIAQLININSALCDLCAPARTYRSYLVIHLYRFCLDLDWCSLTAIALISMPRRVPCMAFDRESGKTPTSPSFQFLNRILCFLVFASFWCSIAVSDGQPVRTIRLG